MNETTTAAETTATEIPADIDEQSMMIINKMRCFIGDRLMAQEMELYQEMFNVFLHDIEYFCFFQLKAVLTKANRHFFIEEWPLHKRKWNRTYIDFVLKNFVFNSIKRRAKKMKMLLIEQDTWPIGRDTWRIFMDICIYQLVSVWIFVSFL